MSKPQLPVPAGFPNLLQEIKTRIQQAQTRAMLSVNAELVQLYWDIGRMIDIRQQEEGWGADVIPRLARELRNDMPEVKGSGGSGRRSSRGSRSPTSYSTPHPTTRHCLEMGGSVLRVRGYDEK